MRTYNVFMLVLAILLTSVGIIILKVNEKPLEAIKTQTERFEQSKLDSLCSIPLPTNFESRKKKVMFLNQLIEE